MAKSKITITQDGQELRGDDLNVIGDAAALADDSVLLELLRPAPFVSGFGAQVAKMILPYGVPPGNTGTLAQLSFVQGAATGVLVMPFRALVGSRSTVAGEGALLNWSDARSVIFAASTDSVNLGSLVTIPTNVSSNARIDLIYATFTVDTQTSLTRYVKPATSGSAAPTPVQVITSQSVALNIALGTPALSPVPATIPADTVSPGTSTINIPIAYVMVTGFYTTGTPMSANNIAIVAPIRNSGGGKPLGVISAAPMECVSTVPANGNADWTAWANTGRGAVPWMMPSTMSGGVQRIFGFNTASITDASVVDQSVDWRNRTFLVHMQACLVVGTVNFSWKAGGGAGGSIPSVGPTGATGAQWFTFGQSFYIDDVGKFANMSFGSSRNGAAVALGNSTTTPTIFTGSSPSQGFGLYVDTTTGALKIFHNFVGTSFTGNVYVHLTASGQYDNYIG